MAAPPSPVSQASTSPSRRRPSVQVPGSGSGTGAGTGSSPRAIPAAVPSRPVPVPLASPRSVPLPVPQRHGSMSVHSGSFHGSSFAGGSLHGSFHGGSIGSASDLTSLSPRLRSGHRTSGSGGSFGGSASLSNSFVLGPAVTDDSDSWLETPAGDIVPDKSTVIPGNTGLEEATEILINSGAECVIVQTGEDYGLFDFADLNTALLLVLSAATKQSTEALDERAQEVVDRLKKGIRLSVRVVCDISGKNPCSTFPPDVTLGRLLPRFASGVHRVIIKTQPPRILEAATLLTHLTKLPPPLFRLCLSEIDLPLHRFVSLSMNASVLDAMQIMSLNGLSALGVVTGEPEREGEQSSLVGVVTVTDCSKLVVPSEGKQALGMGLGDMCKNVMAAQDSGRERGEERVPVHTITPGTTLLHAANLILATSSSRVFMRTPPASSPPLSPVSSFERLSPPISRLGGTTFGGLPNPPPTQLSSQYVVSILDILSCLAHSYQTKLSAVSESAVDLDSYDMSPDSISKRRRRASSSAAFTGFQTWRWAGDPSPF